MAILTDADRQNVWSSFMSQESSRSRGILMNKNELRRAADGIDDQLETWIEGITSGGLTATQVLECLLFIVSRRLER